MSIQNHFIEFEEIIKQDNLEHFKDFYKEYKRVFDKFDYSIIFKYNAKKIFEYYVNKRLRDEDIRHDAVTISNIFHLDSVYKYIVLSNNEEMFEMMKPYLLDWFSFVTEMKSEEELEEAYYEHPYVQIATYCVEYNTNFNLFKKCIETCSEYFSEYHFIYCASVEFFDELMKYTKRIYKIDAMFACCNESQLVHYLEQHKELSNEIHERIAKHILMNEHLSSDFIKTHFNFTLNDFKNFFNSFDIGSISIKHIELCLQKFSISEIRINLKNELQEILQDNYVKYETNEFIKEKLSQIFTENEIKEFRIVSEYCLAYSSSTSDDE